MADLLSLSHQLRRAIERQDEAELERLTVEFQRMVDRLEGDIDALSRDIASGDYTADTVTELRSYERLMRRAEEELNEYQDWLLEELALTAGLWLALGNTNSTLLMVQALTDAGMDADIDPLDDAVIAALNEYLAVGSPLYQRLQQYGSANIDRIRQIIIQSVSLGLNPRELARRLVEAGFGMSLTDALRMARTLQLYAYRDATLANYNANSDVVQGWVWSSALIPGRTCMSCVNMHGTVHTLDETLNDHHNGLCVMLPLVGDNPVKTMGADWFENLPRATQIQMMGKSKWEAWKAGQIGIGDMTGTHTDDVYGEMRIERSLKDILAEKGLT